MLFARNHIYWLIIAILTSIFAYGAYYVNPSLSYKLLAITGVQFILTGGLWFLRKEPRNKKINIISYSIGAYLVLIGAFLKISHLPDANSIIALGLSLECVGVLLTVAARQKELHRQV